LSRDLVENKKFVKVGNYLHSHGNIVSAGVKNVFDIYKDIKSKSSLSGDNRTIFEDNIDHQFSKKIKTNPFYHLEQKIIFQILSYLMKIILM
jgi:hypothetical protein